ncbi:MAG: CHASE3 domain-containing protein [Solirubrobacteraceae bacterium]|nr:CHASE3 domain-containing protein [Solirubrobacteraceae bacterium]
MAADARRMPVVGRLTSGQWLALGSGALALVALAALVVSLVALERQEDRRDVVIDRLDPASAVAQQVLTGLVNQETGIRGFVLTGEESFLEPYREGRAATRASTRRLRTLVGAHVPGVERDLAAVDAAVARWRSAYADPTIAGVRRGDVSARTDPVGEEGKQRFDEIRTTVARLQARMAATRATVRAEVADATRVTRSALTFTGVLVVLTAFLLWLLLRAAVGRPVAALAGTVRRVSRGEFTLRLVPEGARDVRDLTDDVERMRAQIVRELDALERARTKVEAQAEDLLRSNQELEQFAYVASHDLQEPLRKIASFCTLLERRYAGQLDDRADQYIGFAVDGAKRMQQLINDLLAFSRVGRVGASGFAEVDLRDAAEEAVANLQESIAESGAVIDVNRDLPSVFGDEQLLVAVLQNLLSNAIKFRGDAPPRVEVSASRVEDDWVVTVKDNGIGIAPEFADRIFVIFQRLHQKDAYPGTGIGLAMCRKIIEYHGGRIWLDTDATPGTTFRLTLPADERAAPDDEQ